MSILTDDTMKQSQNFLENADNLPSALPTNQLTIDTSAWRALVVEQDWLNGEIDQNARVSEASESVG
ncbi:hypothetical protein CQ10_38110 [Bradyrhizobium valentinum]|uniref:Uncharacterized protein n=1 Tax=Bradyrhizobium valentinum TaxID=1518501 RepID=A0A0R3LEA5_9BRAD|nr:hypothetical protein CQ10_38110 [Bradyrhizobium valentinum]KRR03280.1 hypothetical protein CP49_15200 [Bradyrhizobium valentinum]